MAETGTNERIDRAVTRCRSGLRRRVRRALYARLRQLPSLVVAYSGGVDSAFLAWAAKRTLGDSRALRHGRQRKLSRSGIARWPWPSRATFTLNHEIIRTGELERPEYRANEPDRCYHCKHELYTHAFGACRASADSRPLPMAATPTTAATIVRAAKPRANLASSARSMKPA